MADFMIQPAETLATEYWKRVRQEPCFNTTNEDIPPFAIMQKRRPKTFSETVAQTKHDPRGATYDGNYISRFYCQHLRRDQVLWDVFKCDSFGAGHQNPSEFCFNGPFVIPKLSPGLCTHDFPCQVLHDGSTDFLPNFAACGPVEDQWYVKSGGTAFTCVSHDISLAAGNGDMHTIWIDRPTGKIVGAHGRFSISATDLDAGEYLLIGADSLKNNLTNNSPWLTMTRDGLYLISFHGKLTSTDASRGEELAITLYQKQADDDDGTEHDPEATPYIACRDQDIEKACSGGTSSAADIQTTAENVAFTGIENLKKDYKVALKNSSSKKITLTNGVLTIAAMGNYFDDGSDNSDDGSPDTLASS